MEMCDAILFVFQKIHSVDHRLLFFLLFWSSAMGLLSDSTCPSSRTFSSESFTFDDLIIGNEFLNLAYHCELEIKIRSLWERDMTVAINVGRIDTSLDCQATEIRTRFSRGRQYFVLSITFRESWKSASRRSVITCRLWDHFCYNMQRIPRGQVLDDRGWLPDGGARLLRQSPLWLLSGELISAVFSIVLRVFFIRVWSNDLLFFLLVSTLVLSQCGSFSSIFSAQFSVCLFSLLVSFCRSRDPIDSFFLRWEISSLAELLICF